MTRAVLSAALALCGAPDLAEPMVTDRPDFTESSSAVPTGRIQLEVGGTHVELEEASESSLGANLGVARPTGGEGRFTSAWGVTNTAPPPFNKDTWGFSRSPARCVSVLTRKGAPDTARLLFSRAALILKPLAVTELSCQTR